MSARDVQSFIGPGRWLWRKPPGAVSVRVTITGPNGTESRSFAARELSASYLITIPEPAAGGATAAAKFETLF